MNKIPDKKIYELHAEVCKALAHPLRMEVIDILQEKELCFTDILEQSGGLKSNLSQHLSIMVGSGVLKVRKDSRCNYYSIASHKVAEACSLMREVLMEKLKNELEIHNILLN